MVRFLSATAAGLALISFGPAAASEPEPTSLLQVRQGGTLEWDSTCPGVSYTAPDGMESTSSCNGALALGYVFEPFAWQRNRVSVEYTGSTGGGGVSGIDGSWKSEMDLSQWAVLVRMDLALPSWRGPWGTLASWLQPYAGVGFRYARASTTYSKTSTSEPDVHLHEVNTQWNPDVHVGLKVGWLFLEKSWLQPADTCEKKHNYGLRGGFLVAY